MRFWPAFVIGAILLSLTRLTKLANTPERVQRIAQAISVAEGFGPPNNLATRRNNPGAIRDMRLPPDYPIKEFPTLAEGWAALYKQVDGMLSGSALYPPNWTLEQVAQRYTGEAQYMNWARNVARILGVSTKIVFSEIP